MTDTHELMDDIASSTDSVVDTENSTLNEPSETLPFDPAYDSRRQRIFDHRVEAQAETNTIIACLAGVNSDLFDTELIVAETLRQGLAASGGSLEMIERHGPLIDLMLRLSKHITQITQLEQRSRKDCGESAAAKSC